VPVRAIGIAWYRREDYDRLMSMFPDREKLAGTFDDWLHNAERTYNRLLLEGFVIEKALLDPETFPNWCRANGMKMDAEGRLLYAREYAAKKHGAESTGMGPGITPA
jgi:hypothetical protein